MGELMTPKLSHSTFFSNSEAKAIASIDVLIQQQKIALLILDLHGVTGVFYAYSRAHGDLPYSGEQSTEHVYIVSPHISWMLIVLLVHDLCTRMIQALHPVIRHPLPMSRPSVPSSLALRQPTWCRSAFIFLLPEILVLPSWMQKASLSLDHPSCQSADFSLLLLRRLVDPPLPLVPSTSSSMKF